MSARTRSPFVRLLGAVALGLFGLNFAVALAGRDDRAACAKPAYEAAQVGHGIDVDVRVGDDVLVVQTRRMEDVARVRRHAERLRALEREAEHSHEATIAHELAERARVEAHAALDAARQAAALTIR